MSDETNDKQNLKPESEAGPREELLRALDKLEDFMGAESRELSLLERTVDILQGLLRPEYNAQKAMKKARVKKDLIKSISLIKSYLPLIDRYQKGTSDQRKIYETVFRTIERYNASLIGNALGADLKIDTTPTVSYQKISTSAQLDQKIESLYHARTITSNPQLSQFEVDTLKMKMIAFESKQGLDKLPLDESIASETSQATVDDKTVTVFKTWNHLPGEVLGVIGNFRREKTRSIPIALDTFIESFQPGHPYPQQHMGWSLSHWLIPSAVLWIDQIPLFRPIFERKIKAGKALLPRGEKNPFARKMYQFKRQVFDENKAEYLHFHHELSAAIFKANPHYADLKKQDAITKFYETLSTHPHPFEELSQTNTLLNQVFIETPFEKVEEMWLIRFDPALADPDKQKRQDALSQLYKKTRKKEIDDFLTKETDPIRCSYLMTMGELLGDSAESLLTLQLSEKIGIKPPMLSDFDLKIQACTFKHLIEFLDELDEEVDLDNPEEVHHLKEKMRMQIQSEIELFNSRTFDETDPFLQELVDEVVSYFHARFHEL